MSSEARHHPASVLFIGIVAGLLAGPHLLSPEAALWATALSSLVSLGFRGDLRLILCLFFASIAVGVMVADRDRNRRDEIRQIVRSLPDDRFVTIHGVIDEEWRSSRSGVFSRLNGFQIRTAEGDVTIPERLSIYAPASVERIGGNDYIELEGFLREARSGSLYVSVKSRHLIKLSAGRSWWHPRHWNRMLRSALESHVSAFPEHERAVSLIRAISLGDGSALSAELLESYRRGGTYHLLVFSGMQIAFAGTLIALLLRLLRLRFATDLSLVALAVIAPAFAGNDPSVSRAATMIGTYGLSRLLGRPTPLSNLLFLSAAVRLVARPEELSSPGFLLTYGATFGLVIIGQCLADGINHPFGKALAYGVGAELCTQPITLLFFRHFVVGGFAVTMVLSPLLGAILLLTVPIAISLAADSSLTWLLVEIVAQLDGLAVAINEIWSGMKLSGFAPAPPTLLVVASYAASWLASYSRARSFRRASAVAAILLLPPVATLILVHRGQEDVPAIEFLDVGQGDSTLIRASKTILIDGGGSPSDPDFGRRTLVPLLADRGIRRLDVVVMSHPDIDHCGGLVGLVRSIPVSELWLSPRHIGASCTTDLLSSLERETRLRFVRDGETILVGATAVTVTLPRLRFKQKPLNNGSVVLTARVSGVRIVLTGDLEREAETLIAEEAAERLRGDILKVPHHGSRTSSSRRFLQAVRPRAAVISCGQDNLHGHPASEVLDRLKDHRAQVFRTDRAGSIRITIDGTCLTLHSQHDELPVRLTRGASCS
ncbi:MAG: DNA internalization-related competence protein ComEC/Rec2 [Acidobacteria bacterium]|nr:DNA internalization-related competence protein ComEC/Rec2 [Acidobacteriota bacterium]